MILRASPSAMAVLPTPGSPISMALALVRRASTNSISSISRSRPITGSIFLALALAVRLVQNCMIMRSNCAVLASVAVVSSSSLTSSFFTKVMN